MKALYSSSYRTGFLVVVHPAGCLACYAEAMGYVWPADVTLCFPALPMYPRISYWIASGRRIMALTMFAKTKMRETAEEER